MLKSTFKKVSAIAIAGTMLAGMMAVPANAMSETQKPVTITTTALSQNFNTLSGLDLSGTKAAQDVIAEKITYASESWGGPSKLVSATIEGTDDVYLKHTHGTNADSGLIAMKLDSSVTLASNAELHVSYDMNPFTIESDQTYFNMGFHTDKKYSAYNGKYNSYDRSNLISYKSGKIGIVTGDAITLSADTWYTVDVTIKYADAEYDNEQTVELKVVNKATRETVGTQKCKFDADATGQLVNWAYQHDGTYDKLGNVDTIYFRSSALGSNFATIGLDNVDVKLLTDSYETVLVSDLSNVVLNETFDNLESSTASNNAKRDLTGTSFKMWNNWWNTMKIDPDTVEGNAVAKVTTAPGGSLLAANLGGVAIGANDEIHVSYDREFYTSWRSGINMTNDGFSVGGNDVGTRVTSLDGSKSGTGAIEAFSNRQLALGGIQGMDLMGVEGQTHHVEYIIKVSDPDHGNRQTIEYTISGAENSLENWNGKEKRSSWSSGAYYFDADNTDENVDTKITSLNNIGLYVEGPSAYNLDNVKVEVVKPGFEVKDVANTGNTYTFRTNDPIDLKYVVDASAASKVIIAQYAEGGRLLSAATQDVDASGRGTVTVTPDSSANKIKVMVLDMSNARPYTKAFVMTRQ